MAHSRWSLIVGFGLCLAGCLLAANARAADTPQAPETVSGKVFLDANRNGRLDPGEAGLAGMRLTDGVQFVTTAADGSYRLTIAPDYMIPYRPARTVAISWPSGKWPTGRWWVRLSEVTDAQRVDFGLREDVQKLPFAFVHMSDDHGMGKMYSEHYGPDVRRMGEAVKFCFNTGDMGYATLDGAEAMFQSIAGHVAKFPVPMFITPGNHDHVGEDPKKNIRMDSHPLVGHGAMTKYCGPVRWSFDYAGVHFVSIDYMEKTEKGYEDFVPRIGIDWADKDLALVHEEAKRGTVPRSRAEKGDSPHFCEAPSGPFREMGTVPFSGSPRVVVLVHCYNAPAEFFRLLRKYKPNYVCCGHTHTPSHVRLAGVPSHTNYGLCTMVVTEGAIDVAEGVPATFSDRVIFGYFRGVTCPAMEKRRQKQHSVAEGPLGGTPKQLQGDPAAESAELLIEIEPGAAKKVVVRFGQKETIDLTFDGKSVDVAGAPFPIGLPPGQKTLRWHILMDRDRLTIFGNDLFRTTKAVKVDAPARVAISADGAGAKLVKADLWELRPIRNQNSRSLHHFAIPSWYWGRPQLQGACLEQTDKESLEMLKRVSPDGITDIE